MVIMKKEIQAKIILFSIASIILISILASFVLAQTTSTIGQNIKDTISSIFSPLFIDNAWGTRALLAMLLFLIVFNIMPMIIDETTAGGMWTIFAISVIVTILALWSIPSNFLDAIVTQYGAMGATLLSMIPFLIILLTSVRIRSALAARVIWIFYMIYYFALYIYKIAAVYQFSKIGWLDPEVIPYLAAIVIGIIMFFFIDKIRLLWAVGERSAIEETGKEIAKRGALLHRLQGEELRKSYGVRRR